MISNPESDEKLTTFDTLTTHFRLPLKNLAATGFHRWVSSKRRDWLKEELVVADVIKKLEAEDITKWVEDLKKIPSQESLHVVVSFLLHLSQSE